MSRTLLHSICHTRTHTNTTPMHDLGDAKETVCRFRVLAGVCRNHGNDAAVSDVGGVFIRLKNSKAASDIDSVFVLAGFLKVRCTMFKWIIPVM